MEKNLTRLALPLLLGILPVAFDTTIVSVALHSLTRDLNASVSLIQWITTGYLLAIGLAVPLSGWLADRFGAKGVWLASLGLFLVGSLLSSLAWDAPSLVAFRVVQGLGGGVMLPVMQTIVARASGDASMGRSMALLALPALAGPLFGPFLGGFLLTALDWRWIFWVNLPLGLVGLLLAWRLLPNDPAPAHRKGFDLLGLALLSPALALVLLGLMDLRRWTTLALGAVLAVLFVVHALRKGDEALLDLRLFRLPSFGVANALLFLSGFAGFGALLLLPLYLQQVRGLDALQAGMLLVPQGIGTLLSRGLAGQLTDRVGPRWVVFFGFLLALAGTVPFAVLGDPGEVVLVVALVVRGIGLGGVTVPLMAGAYRGLAKSDMAHASALTRIGQQLGGGLGTALLSVILDGALVRNTATVTGRLEAFQTAFWWAIGFTLAAAAVALALPQTKPSR
jgi:EmrB/QacA subfamily drug resistance transporter